MEKKKNIRGAFKNVDKKNAVKAIFVERISNGETVQSICRIEGMPQTSEYHKWQREDAEFAANIARARIIGHDAIAEDCLKIADESGGDAVIDPLTGKAKFDGEAVQRSKLRVWTRLQLLSKWDPRYADNLKISGNPDAPLKITIIDDVNK